ncbi:hypothetical protein COT72_03350 [archaeon CG10_big_fil_rev_8_21_14_0_10_43_11]|nr:MAG: hypothetical protein COT72_03350 [archaeon CG10_big_fil_rev_8_21_14_0_10_43_11]
MAEENRERIGTFIISIIILAILTVSAFVLLVNRVSGLDEFRADICNDFATIRGTIGSQVTGGDLLSPQGWFNLFGRALGGAQRVASLIPIETICPIFSHGTFTNSLEFGQWAGRYGSLCWGMYDAGSALKPLYAAGNPALCAATEYDFSQSARITGDTFLESVPSALVWSAGSSRSPALFLTKSISQMTLSDYLYASAFYTTRIKDSQSASEGKLVWLNGQDIQDLDCTLSVGSQTKEVTPALCLPQNMRTQIMYCSKSFNDGSPCPANYVNCQVGGSVGEGGCQEVTNNLIARLYPVAGLDALLAQLANLGIGEAADYPTVLFTTDYKGGNTKVTAAGTTRTLGSIPSDSSIAIDMVIELSGAEFGQLLSNIGSSPSGAIVDAYAGARMQDAQERADIFPFYLYNDTLTPDQFRTSPCSLLSGDFAEAFGDDDNANPMCWPWEDSTNACDNQCNPLTLTSGSFKLGYWDWTTEYQDEDVGAEILMGNIFQARASSAAWDDCNGLMFGSNIAAAVVADPSIFNLITGGKPRNDRLLACIVEDSFGPISSAEDARVLWEGGRACSDLTLGLTYEGGKNRAGDISPAFGYCQYHNAECGAQDFSPCT